ncbi:MAG: carboxypeptidase-like regulatory domain-containing protein, partial [Alistipes sp.]|nr:carboxypeptidase-like regulatory domain-containing protein [Alistipes sp.]
MTNAKNIWTLCLLLLCTFAASAQEKKPALSGKVISKDKEEVAFATVSLKGTVYGCSTDQQGMYYLHAPAGKYTLIVSAIGYQTVEKPVTLTGERLKMNIILAASEIRMDEVVVTGSSVGRINRSPFNAVAIGTEELQNSTKSLSEALARTPGMKLRESGGVGSDMSLLMDGFSGKHIKIS